MAGHATHRPPAHPGQILFEKYLQPLAISQAAFANAIGVPSQRVNDIVNSKRGVTPDTALRFEAALGVSAQFWLDAQTAWELWRQLHSPEAAQIRKIKRVNAT
jgi:antitoxin HigA-1